MTDTVQVAMITAVGAALPTTLAVLLAARSQGKKLDQQTSLAQSAAVNTREVRETLATNTTATTHALLGLAVTAESAHQLAEKTHTLVNSNMQAQLKVSAAALRRIAVLTKDAVDVRIADEAERLLAEHVSKQADIDSGQKQ